ncbi:MAG: sigma-70 family RNA polymerase sigma factor [Phycisphaerae bacterium]|nr:sigma-70 family RNA polymerase sigma factor [Phycisphaerae bacterium]
MEKQLENIVIDDAVLVRQCQNGDSAAMQRLIIKYQDRIYNVILKICSNKDDAAELTQETFVKFIEKIDTFKMQSAFYTWLFRIAVNLSLNFCKRRFKVKMHSIDTPSGPEGEKAREQLRSYFADEKEIDPFVAAQNREVGRIIVDALGRLEDKQRVAVVLRDIEGMAYAEIAESLDVGIGTVKSRISRGRESLREILNTVLES